MTQPRSIGKLPWMVAGGLLILVGLLLLRPAQLQYQLWQARRAIAQRRPEQALEWLDAARRLDADSGAVAFWTARVNRRLGNLQAVRESCDRALERGYSAEQIGRERLLMMAQAGRLAPEDPLLSKLLADPQGDSLEIYEALVRGCLESFRIQAANLLLDGWQSDFPHDEQPYFYRGLVLAHETQWPAATEAFLQALQRAPQRHDVRRQFARALRHQHRYREAEAHYAICLEHEEDVESLYGCGQCREALGELDEARQIYTRLLEKMPEHYEGLLALGALELSVGRAEEALPRLQRAFQLKPYEYEVRHALAWSLVLSGQKAEAREHFEAAAEQLDVTVRVNAMIRRAGREPENAELRYDIGATMLACGQPAARQWLNMALQLQPDHQAAREALQNVESRTGNFQ